MRVFVALFLLYPALCLAAAAQVESAHITSDGNHTQVSFDLSAPADHTLFTLSHPNRIVIDLSHTRQRPATLAAHGGLVERIRSAPHGQGGLRIVLDLSQKATPRTLLRQANHGDELVVDLYPAGSGAAALAKPVKVAPSQSAADQKGRDIIVAVDAGHGGIDSGAHGYHGLLEKTITLRIARKLAALINKQPGFKAVLTRNGDYYLKLRQRIALARAAHADLFVSIHCDASHDHHADGATVYALSEHGATSEHARWVANRENDADLIGGVSLADKTSMLASVLLDLSQTATISASLDVGGMVVHDLSQLGPMHRSSVQQAAFVVLKSPDIPSILVETDYITNPHEAHRLDSAWYQSRVAQAILGGVVKYFDHYPPTGTEVALLKSQRERQHNDSYVADSAVGSGGVASGSRR